VPFFGAPRVGYVSVVAPSTPAAARQLLLVGRHQSAAQSHARAPIGKGIRRIGPRNRLMRCRWSARRGRASLPQSDIAASASWGCCGNA